MAATMNSGIGASVLRKEDAPLITGEGRFVDDIKLPGMAYAAFVRSPHAHATITSIDTSVAEGMPGVVKVFTYATLGLEAGVPCASNPFGNAAQPKRPILADGKVRMVGEPVALVVADTQATARDAADRVLVEYDPLPVVIDAENAGKPGAAQIHEEAPANHCLTIEHKTEGFDEVFDAAPVKVSLVIDNQRLTAVPMEPRGVVADWISSSGELTFYTSTQVPHFVRTFVAAICGIPESKVRVVAPDVGGGFGAKIDVYAEEFALAQASRLSGRPVKWIETRTESMVATVAGRDQLQTATLAADRDGRMLALRVHLLQDCGAYLGLLTPSIAHLTVIMVPGALRPQARGHHARRGLHQHDTDRRLSRRGTPGGGAHDRAPRRPAGRRARPRRGRAAAAQLRHRVPVHDRHGPALRLGQLRGRARQGARDVRLRGLRGTQRRGREARQLPRHRPLDLGRDLRPRAVRRDEGDRHRRGRLGVVDRAPAPDRLGDRRHRLLGTRAGPRDVVVADRRERARHPVRPGRRRPRRHGAVALRPRHVRLALAGRRRHGAPADAARRCATRRA